jgi:cystathionine beta-synthase
MVLYLKNTTKQNFEEWNLFYITEGIGEDILKNVDFSLIDGFTKVTDKDAAVYTRKLH